MLARLVRIAILVVVVCLVGVSPAIGADHAAPPYELAGIRDPQTLAVEVVHDWRLVPGAPPTRQKQIVVTACTWWPGRDIRLPVIFVAPAEGGPFPFVISSIGLTSGRAVRPDELEQALLPSGVAFVRVGIGQIDQMESSGILADEMNALFLKTKEVRYTPPWFWGLTYMDDRVTVVVPLVAPIYSEPQYNPEYPDLDEEYLRLAEMGKTELVVDEVSRLRAIRANKNRYLLDDDYLDAGWTRQDMADAEWRLGELHLALYNVPRWDARGVDYFFQMGTNDNITPRL